MESSQNPRESFACSVCGKDCGNKKSQLRHVSYCKKVKSRGHVKSRKRACSACTKAKTQCDLIHPSCLRCSRESLGCIYEGLQLSRRKVLEPEEKRLAGNDADQIEELPLTLSSSQNVASPVLLNIHEASVASYPFQILDLITEDTLNLELPNQDWNFDIEE
ncbi:hypothetical protein BOTCAL_0092g00340 [Botryotinia calthae]|uniref:Zn(2)-C6 fungal-type domain-containing protein n=1 Tax=Botryotinia calthae TaxID=38488 RepID=A0A4Y8D9B4_9HELO|nr:hypothetical protein BOTCAL_0092g00340 [Botryotinia calthae]